MTKRANGLLAVAATVLLGLSLAAQQGQGQNPPQDPATGGQMSMGDMMKGCRERCDATSKSMSQIAAAMDDAKQSNDPGKMRAAMDRMQKPMAEMKEHMHMCMRMMDMMQGMHGKGGMMSGMMGGQKPSPSPAPSAKTALDIALTTQPNPPKTGENTFEVTVKDADGNPVTDAAVTVNVYMAAMPSMNMPEMRSSATLKHVSAGRYRGTGNVAMAGQWDATVVVTRAGKEIGSRKLAITAR